MDREICFGTLLDNTEYRRRTGVYAVIIVGREVATIRTSQGHCFLPGGGIETEENHFDCLRREVIEELGYEVEISDYIGVAEQYFISTTNEPIFGIGHFYLCTLLDITQSITEPEHQICWANTQHVEELMFLEYQAWAVKQALKIGDGHF